MTTTNVIPFRPQDSDAVATQQQTLQALLDKSKRSAVPLRRSFLQAGQSGGAGALALLVRKHQALDLFLLSVGLASHEPWEVKMEAGTLGRALGWGDGRRGRLAVSRAAAELDEVRLIERFNVSRKTGIRLLREDASGSPYTNPDGKSVEDRYLRIPLAYWLEGWQNSLSLPEKVVLLIALARGPGFTLPQARAHQFYGISEDTVHRGIIGLTNRQLLFGYGRRVPAPLAGKGFTYVNEYWLASPFSRQSSSKKEVVPTRVPAGELR